MSVSTHFDGALRSLFDVLFGAGADRFPDATEDAVVLTAVKDATRRWRGGPKAGPSLTAAARAGRSRVQVGTEGYMQTNIYQGYAGVVA